MAIFFVIGALVWALLELGYHMGTINAEIECNAAVARQQESK